MNEHPVLEDLLQRIERRSATVGIIGMGYVGLPLALVFHEAGFPVVGFDVDPSKIDALHRGESYIRHIGPDRVAAAFGVGTTPSPGPAIRGTTDFNRLAECDAVLVCVPTPLGEHRDPDLTYVVGTAETIAKHLRKGQLVILESTTYPGTTRDELLPRFEARTDAAEPRSVAAPTSSSRSRRSARIPGNRHFTRARSRRSWVASTRPRGAPPRALYGAAIDTIVPVSSAEVAESSKLLENIFRASTSRWSTS
jgi:UDP-N-acetyl-D-glucosamine dehydrogenase